ncbi:FAD-dependent oxidoreductase [Actibacterium sp. D379-3]
MTTGELNMQTLNRRRFAHSLLAGAVLLGGTGSALRQARASGKAVIVGGGPAGTAAALALRHMRPDLAILLIERDPGRLAENRPAPRPFSRPSTALDFSALRAASVEVALDEVVEVDWTASRLSLFSGRGVAFDRLLMAPGTAPVDEAIEGMDAIAHHRWPAAWGSPREALRLSAQLSALPETGHVVLRLPAGPLSHPKAALSRACDLASFLDRHRPRARLTVLDATSDPRLADSFAMAAGKTGGLDQTVWRSRTQGGTVLRVDARRGLLETDAGLLRADVVNFVTPHGAGQIARSAGLVDASGWCPCDPQGRSTLRARVSILGDARTGSARTIEGAVLSARTAALDDRPT